MMLKRTAIIALSIAAILSISACQPGQTAALTDAPTLPAATQTRTPSVTLQPAAPPALTLTAQPSSTTTPEPQADMPHCFTPVDILPFAFMPDNARLLIRTGSGVQVFNLETLEEERFLEAPQNVYTAAISPDGSILAWSLEDNTIQLIRLSDQAPIATLVGHPDLVYDLRFSPAGDRLYSASHDGVVRIWDTQGDLVASIDAGGELLGMGISPDGSRLATIPFDGALALWDTASGERVAEFVSTGGYDTSDAVFSPDAQYLAADLATGIYLWRVADGELLWNDIKNSMAVAFSPDGTYLAYSDVDDSNKVFLAEPDGAQIVNTIDQMQGPVWEMFFSPDGSRLAATDGIEIRIWRVEDGKLIYLGKTSCP